MLRALPVVLTVALTIYCVVDVIQSDDDAVRGLPKLVWLLLILLFPLVGSVAWFLAGRPPRQPTPIETQRDRWAQGRERREKDRPPRGPDDDPDFLKGL